MNDRVTKNYFKDGGNSLVIGGKLVVEEDATVEGLDTGGEIPVASSSVLGGVRIGSGLNVTGGGTLSVAPATADVAGAVKKMPFQGRCVAISLVEVENSINGILQKLQAAGLMAPEE